MKTRLPPLVLLAASMLFLLAGNGMGQFVPPPPGYGQAAPSPRPPAHALPESTSRMLLSKSPSESIRFNDTIEKKRVEANFENLPLTEVVVWLEKTFPDVNFVLPQRLVEANPALILRLRAAGLRDILEAINIATDGTVVFEVRSPTLVALRPRTEPGLVAIGPVGQALPGDGGTQTPQRDLDTPRSSPRYGYGAVGGGYGVIGGGGGGQGMAMLQMAPDAEPLSYQVINLPSIMRVNDPVKIRQTLEMAEKLTERTLHIMMADSPGPRRSPRIKSFEYHEGSGVLVIIGQREAINLAMDIIRNLRVQDTGGGAGRSAGTEKPGEPK